MSNTSVQPLLRFVVTLQLILTIVIVATGQSPSPTPDSRGLGVQSSGTQSSSQATQQAREAKPQLVLQTGYNQIFGATRLVFSPDGRLLATGAYRTSSIKLWETATGRELRVLSTGVQGAAGFAPAIAFSRDNRFIAAAAGDNTAKVWEVTSGREVQSFAGPQGSIVSSLGMHFVGFGINNQLVTISDAIRVWDVNNGKELRALTIGALDLGGFNGMDGSATLTPNGDQLAIIRTDPRPQIKFLDLATLKEVRTVDLPDKELQSLQISFASDGHLQVVGQIDKRLKLWDFNPKQNERDLGPTQKEFSQIKFSRDGRLLALSENQQIKVWEVASAKELSNFKAPSNISFTSDVSAFVAFSEDSKRMATGGINTPTIIWEVDTAKQVMKLNGRTNMAYNVTFSADGNRLTSGGRTVWDLRTGRGLRVSAIPTEHIFAYASPDGKLIAASTPTSPIIDVIEIPSGRRILQLDGGVKPLVVQEVHFSADGSMLIATYGPGFDSSQSSSAAPPTSRVKIWEVKTGKELHTLSTTDSAIDAQFNGDGRMAAIIGQQGQISLWETASGSKIRDLSSSPMPNVSAAGSATINPGSLPNIKPGQMPNIPNMPNLADMQTMMTNMMGAMSAGTWGGP